MTGALMGRCKERLDAACADLTVYAFKMSDEPVSSKYNFQMSGVKFNGAEYAKRSAEAKVIINNEDLILSFKLNITENLPIIAIPLELLNCNNPYKNVKYQVTYDNITYSVILSFIPCGIGNDKSDNYILIIPIMVKNSTFKYIVKYSEYLIMFNEQKIKIRLPKITENGTALDLMPFFILPRRIYPSFIYIKAIELYKNGTMSQRQVAEEIRKEFKLKKFSASTVSRVFNSASKDISSKPLDAYNVDTNIITSQKSSSESDLSKDCHIASINSCQKNRFNVAIKIETVNSFFNSLPKLIFSGGLIINFKLFMMTLFDKFSKHFLIPLPRSQPKSTG